MTDEDRRPVTQKTLRLAVQGIAPVVREFVEERERQSAARIAKLEKAILLLTQAVERRA